jgi:hypothetical protein
LCRFIRRLQGVNDWGRKEPTWGLEINSIDQSIHVLGTDTGPNRIMD